MLVRNAEIAGSHRDLRCDGDRISEIGVSLPSRSGEETLDAAGGALLRGLHDHHLHLFSLAAALASISCGPPNVENADALAARLAGATPKNGWLRGTGYFESVAGPLNRDRLDALAPPIPIRIQHRSGAMWFLNSPALEALGLESGDAPEGLERDASGRPTGRLFRADGWLRERLPATGAPNLAEVGACLARFGVTGVTDATPSNSVEEWKLFEAAQACGAFPQRIRVMGRLDLKPGLKDAAESRDATSRDSANEPRLTVDAHKILLDEPALPDLAALAEALRKAHASDRGVAIHTVTRAELLFSLAAFDMVGTHPGDRLEHASVAPPEALAEIERLGLRVCTQPNFVAERGDAYQRDVAPVDQPYLYRVSSWLERSVALGFGTDAPFGSANPWHAIRAAVERRTRSGAQLGAGETVAPEAALALFDPARLKSTGSEPLKDTERKAPRALRVGDPADLCLLGLPWIEARSRLSEEDVLATICGGQIVYRRA